MFRTSDVKELIEACGKGEREKVGNLLKNVKPNVIHVCCTVAVGGF